MSEKIRDFLDQAANSNALEAEQTFKEIISQKVQDRLEAMRADIMSNEEVEIINEELNELSKKTLGSYVNKSTKDIANTNLLPYRGIKKFLHTGFHGEGNLFLRL